MKKKQRIKLGKPYEKFIQNLIESGYYGTATEVIPDALRDKMEKVENDRIANIRALIAEGEEDVKEGGLLSLMTII
jgi:putative addiction module CopG family antidote